jgi:hypothetical protein
MEQSPSWEANQYTLQLVKKFPAFMEIESSSPYPQDFLCTLSFKWMVIMTWTTPFSFWNIISWFGKVIQQQNSQHILNWRGRCITPTNNICSSYYKGTQIHCSFLIETISIQQSHYWHSAYNRFSGVKKYPVLCGIPSVHYVVHKRPSFSPNPRSDKSSPCPPMLFL